MDLHQTCRDKDNQKGLDSLNFCQIPSPTTDLAALERLKKSMDNVVSTLAPSFLNGFILVGNKDSYKILDGLEIRKDQTRACGVSCP